ncbi:MAG: 4Fe-4S ferredoxin, partial [Halobacteria archaeon]|nr:4Fe-4S ferredoxin [Halobacteria archaeon]
MSEQQGIDIYRRRFLGNTAKASAGLALAPGIMLTELGQARPTDEPVHSGVRWGMLVDSNKCAEGCNDCVQACNDEHGLSGFDRPATDAQWIRKVRLKDKLTGHTQTLPMLCQHCEH